MSIVINRNTARNTASAGKVIPKFNISLTKDDNVEFRPTATFQHVTTEQVLKIISKGSIDVTAENNAGKVNFKVLISSGTAVKNAGFINYYDNDLDDDSLESEIKAVCDSLSKSLSAIKIDAIALPMTKSEADDLIDNL
jgi:hypothetical protein|tara:strand:- start:221 stop:637 length:417 start_codon:yes stop_codon:yes gene_type:complete